MMLSKTAYKECNVLIHKMLTCRASTYNKEYKVYFNNKYDFLHGYAGFIREIPRKFDHISPIFDELIGNIDHIGKRFYYLKLNKKFFVMPGFLGEVDTGRLKTLLSIVIPSQNSRQFHINFSYGLPYLHLMEIHINKDFTKNNYKTLFTNVNNHVLKPLSWCKFIYVDDFKHLYNFPKEVPGSTFRQKIENQNKYGQFVLNKLANAS